jgi:hypothetical protein
MAYHTQASFLDFSQCLTQKQDTYNTTLGHFCVTVVVMEKQYMLNTVCICTLSLDVWHANHFFAAPYYIVICGLSDCHIFPHYQVT